MSRANGGAVIDLTTHIDYTLGHDGSGPCRWYTVTLIIALGPSGCWGRHPRMWVWSCPRRRISPLRRPGRSPGRSFNRRRPHLRRGLFGSVLRMGGKLEIVNASWMNCACWPGNRDQIFARVYCSPGQSELPACGAYLIKTLKSWRLRTIPKNKSGRNLRTIAVWLGGWMQHMRGQTKAGRSRLRYLISHLNSSIRGPLQS